MKKTEFESIKKAVSEGHFITEAHSYGTYGKGYICNHKLFIEDKEHENTYGRKVYYIYFNADTWFKVKPEGTFYNNRYHGKYKDFDDKIYKALHGDEVELSQKLYR